MEGMTRRRNKHVYSKQRIDVRKEYAGYAVTLWGASNIRRWGMRKCMSVSTFRVRFGGAQCKHGVWAMSVSTFAILILILIEVIVVQLPNR